MTAYKCATQLDISNLNWGGNKEGYVANKLCTIGYATSQLGARRKSGYTVENGYPDNRIVTEDNNVPIEIERSGTNVSSVSVSLSYRNFGYRTSQNTSFTVTVNYNDGTPSKTYENWSELQADGIAMPYITPPVATGAYFETSTHNAAPGYETQLVVNKIRTGVPEGQYKVMAVVDSVVGMSVPFIVTDDRQVVNYKVDFRLSEISLKFQGIGPSNEDVYELKCCIKLNQDSDTDMITNYVHEYDSSQTAGNAFTYRCDVGNTTAWFYKNTYQSSISDSSSLNNYEISNYMCINLNSIEIKKNEELEFYKYLFIGGSDPDYIISNYTIVIPSLSTSNDYYKWNEMGQTITKP